MYPSAPPPHTHNTCICTGYRIFSLCHVPEAKLLIGAGVETSSQTPALLSISADHSSNYLGPKDVRAPGAVSMKVESLHTLQSLSTCVATSVNGSITVFDVAKGVCILLMPIHCFASRCSGTDSGIREAGKSSLEWSRVNMELT